MRLHMGAVVCIATLYILSPCRAASDRSAAAPSTDPKSQQVDWLSLEHNHAPSTHEAGNSTAVDHRTSDPVPLPLPTEAWASLALLATMACVRGLKRARLI